MKGVENLIIIGEGSSYYAALFASKWIKIFETFETVIFIFLKNYNFFLYYKLFVYKIYL